MHPGDIHRGDVRVDEGWLAAGSFERTYPNDRIAGAHADSINATEPVGSACFQFPDLASRTNGLSWRVFCVSCHSCASLFSGSRMRLAELNSTALVRRSAVGSNPRKEATRDSSCSV